MAARAVLVTRPEPACAETCREIESRGRIAIAAPFATIETRVVPPQAVAPAAVLVTSSNALAALAPIAGTPLLAVGDATAARARARGWTDCRSADGDGADLLALCRATLRPERGPLLVLAGEGHGAALRQGLERAGFAVTIAVAYAQARATAFPDAASEALRTGAVGEVVFFAPSAARGFAETLPPALRPALATVRALAISAGAAAPVRDLGWRELDCAVRPNSADLLALL